MKRLLETAIIAVTLLCPASRAATILQLDPIGGAISGLPGSTIGWGFTLTNDTDYLVVTSANFTPATALGLFTDFISFAFIIVGPAPESTVVTQPFDAFAGTGIGSFQIDPLAAAGAVALGQIELTYDLYSVSPNDPTFDPIVHTISVGNLLSAAASVTVAGAEIPEPASFFLVAAGLAVAARLRKQLSPGRDNRPVPQAFPHPPVHLPRNRNVSPA